MFVIIFSLDQWFPGLWLPGNLTSGQYKCGNRTIFGHLCFRPNNCFLKILQQVLCGML